MVLSEALPPIVLGGATIITASTWLILLVTTMSLFASATPARKLPTAQPIAMAIIYVYVARIGATMDLSEVNLETVGAFVAMCFVWIFIHGAFVLLGAWIFRVDIHGCNCHCREYWRRCFSSDSCSPPPGIAGAGIDTHGHDRLCPGQLPWHTDWSACTVDGRLSADFVM